MSGESSDRSSLVQNSLSGESQPRQYENRDQFLLEGGVEIMGKTALLSEVKVETPVEILDCGVLSDLEWPGAVSAKNLVETGVTSKEIIGNAVERINEFYVPVNPMAKTRCIDGRHDPEMDETNLGPQVPGGAPGAALAWRLGVDKDDLTRGTFLIDAESMVSNFLRLGFAPGGHRDSHSAGEKVGCGAIDGMDAILSTMTEPKLVDDHKRVVKLLMGSAFDRDTYLRVMGAAVVVNGRSEDYFRGREAVLDMLEKRSKKSTATLQGSHQESIVSVNMVPGTTLSSNHFSKEFNGVQAFGYDLWDSLRMAGKLMPRPDQGIDRERYVMARVMTTVATLMALTDGTQRLVLRMPGEAADYSREEA